MKTHEYKVRLKKGPNKGKIVPVRVVEDKYAPQGICYVLPANISQERWLEIINAPPSTPIFFDNAPPSAPIMLDLGDKK